MGMPYKWMCFFPCFFDGKSYANMNEQGYKPPFLHFLPEIGLNSLRCLHFLIHQLWHGLGILHFETNPCVDVGRCWLYIPLSHDIQIIFHYIPTTPHEIYTKFGSSWISWSYIDHWNTPRKMHLSMLSITKYYRFIMSFSTADDLRFPPGWSHGLRFRPRRGATLSWKVPCRGAAMATVTVSFFLRWSEAYRNIEIRHVLVIFDDFCVFGQTGWS